MYQIIDRGFDREYRFCCKVPATVSEGDRIDTEHGPLLVFSVGRTFGEPPMRYAYVDVDAATVGAPTDRLTPEQAAYRERAPAYVRKRANDEAAAAAVLAALERDGWSNRSNTPGVPSALKRVYRELVASHVLRLEGTRYVPA